MKLVVLDRTYTPTLGAAITYEAWMQVNHALDGCLKTRQADWLYSLVSVQGDRSLCVFSVPYAEAVREACREARMPFQQVWPTQYWVDLDPTHLPQGSSLILAETVYDPPLTPAIYEAEKQQAAGCFQELNIQHAFSLVTLDGTRSVCAFVATTAEDVRSLYRKTNAPFEHVWKAILIRPT